MPYKLKSSARRSRRNKRIGIAVGIALVALIIGGVLFYVFSQSNPPTTPLVQGSAVLEVKGWNTTNPEQTGNITILLRDDKPITSSHFKSLVEQGKYDGTLFHRVIKDFMIQGGHIEGVSSIPDEIGSNNSNVRGTVTMANAGANTASSDFFINTVDNSGTNRYAGFDTSYTVFGTVTQGMDIVDAISNVPVDDPTGQSPKPLQDVTIVKAIALS
jgi:peptidylprolyl isomerase